MDQVAKGIQSDEFSGDKESSGQQCCLSKPVTRRRSTLFSPTISSSRKVNTVKIGQLEAQHNKPPLSGKTYEQPNKRSREKIDSAGRVSSRVNKPLDLQQGKVNATPATPTKASTRCNKSYASPGTSTPMEKGKTRITGSRSRPSMYRNNNKTLSKSLSLASEAPIHHIKCDEFSRTPKNVGVRCVLCEEDLSNMPSDSLYESGYYENEDSRPWNYPEVAVLHCGHSFHIRCFAYSIPDEQCSDPPCVLCDSCMS